MSDSTSPGGGQRSPTPDAHHAPWMGGAPRTAAATAVGALAGAVAGTAVGLGTMAAGPIGTLLGAFVGAEVMEIGSQASATEPSYTEEHDAHYRALWESDAGRPADVPFDAVRPAYRFGHLSAFEPAFVGRDFVAAEEELRVAWERDFAAPDGDWAAVRQHVCDAYGHSRVEDFGLRRDADVIGSAGSAVDPVELGRARSGLTSVDGATTAGIAYDHPGYAEVNNANSLGTAPAAAVSESGRSGGLGEWPETDASTAHRNDPGYH